MDHYIEIRLKPDPEFSTSLLMNALFAKLHRALAEKGDGQVGVSFPKADKNLGDTIRLHSTQESLERLVSLNWMKGLHDYATESHIRPIPLTCQHRTVKRIQSKSSPTRLLRRSVNKGWVTEAEAEERLKESPERRLKDPFIQIKSQSTNQMFRLFIRQGPLLDNPQPGYFSAYGLSHQATIPWF
ncbi:type I-F CRISPR-associated endoribonuclease Cas6/Csy4 [Nitrosococcus oceani]|uniref:type I-F CRISPR-associated endoribonuclease Cas6/Csy4 n=1 Tax=Nitrosococcus oceani TaxID=1229 RepID=UPI0004E95B1A|nr:type I-F CRISPR-associated endoribonuclease Cas6/Csy4 [Nitrosococcus oceani]KFI21591.1 CRISPR-associated protein Csy4 [Nitrosococcus oceani]